MADSDTPSNTPTHRRAVPQGVGGWLLLLCLMLTVVGPLITTGLLVRQHPGWPPGLAPGRSLSMLAQLLASLSLLAEAGSMLYGIYAGLGLWRRRPGAVRSAKAALLLGLAANAVSVTAQWVVGPSAQAAGGLLHALNLGLLPDLVFFTASFAYLNKSARVQATYLV